MNIKDKALKLDDNVQVKIELMSPRQKKEKKKDAFNDFSNTGVFTGLSQPGLCAV